MMMELCGQKSGDKSLKLFKKADEGIMMLTHYLIGHKQKTGKIYLMYIFRLEKYKIVIQMCNKVSF